MPRTMVPNEGTIMWRIFNALHIQWHSVDCAREFPHCETWTKTWLEGHEFDSADIETAVIEMFEYFHEAGDDIPFPELDIDSMKPEEVPLAMMPATHVSGGHIPGGSRIRTGEVAGFGPGGIVHVRMGPSDRFEGADKVRLGISGYHRRVDMVVEEPGTGPI